VQVNILGRQKEKTFLQTNWRRVCKIAKSDF